MITHLRDKAIKHLIISFALLVLGFGCMVAGAKGFPPVLVVLVGILAGIFALIFYVKGNIALAEAKGHTGGTVAAIIIVASICSGILFFAMPLIILFGLEDKMKKRKRSHRSEPREERRNPVAELPPRRDE